MAQVTTPHSSKCRSCGAAVTLANSRTGALIPLDALPSLAGTFFISPSWQAIGVDATGEFAASCRNNDAPRYTSHHATCPNRKVSNV